MKTIPPSSSPDNPDERSSDEDLAKRLDDFMDEAREIMAAEFATDADPRAAQEPELRPHLFKWYLAKVRVITEKVREWILRGRRLDE